MNPFKLIEGFFESREEFAMELSEMRKELEKINNKLNAFRGSL